MPQKDNPANMNLFGSDAKIFAAISLTELNPETGAIITVLSRDNKLICG